MTHLVGLVLVAVGCAVAALSSVAALAVGDDVFARLHYLTPVTSVAVPLAGIGLSIDSGQPWVIAEVLTICLLLAVAGAALESATARVIAGEHDIVEAKQPQ